MGFGTKPVKPYTNRKVMKSVRTLIEEAGREYKQHEMDEPVLLDGTSEMHARNALNHLHNQRWEDAVREARIAAEQRPRWQRFSEVVVQICELSNEGRS
jgi:hypothetical protein